MFSVTASEVVQRAGRRQAQRERHRADRLAGTERRPTTA